MEEAVEVNIEAEEKTLTEQILALERQQCLVELDRREKDLRNEMAKQTIGRAWGEVTVG